MDTSCLPSTMSIVERIARQWKEEGREWWSSVLINLGKYYNDTYQTAADTYDCRPTLTRISPDTY